MPHAWKQDTATAISELLQPDDDLRWQELYREALFEPDPDRLLEQIDRAETAIVLRAQQLLEEKRDHVEEEQELDDALYALQALKQCVHWRSCVRN